MNRIHPWTLAICLTLTRILPAAEFGTVPDPYTGNWSGTVKSNAKESPVHATVIAYKNRYPAGLWQTYDIEFKAPRFSPEGNKTTDARMTVRLNGILIHNDVAVPKPTGGGKETARGPIILQDHGNPVQFRNIWVVKLN